MLDISPSALFSLDERICALGANQVPYFRTPEFSEVMLENERLFLKFAGAPEGSRAVFLTGSGTAGMEAAVMNTLDASDKAIVVDGGSFGHRFVKLLEVHGIEHTAIALEAGSALTEEDLAPFAGAGLHGAVHQPVRNLYGRGV